MQVPGWLNQDLSSINCSTPVRDRPDSCELTTLVQSTFGHHGWWMQPTSKLEYESGLANIPHCEMSIVPRPHETTHKVWQRNAFLQPWRRWKDCEHKFKSETCTFQASCTKRWTMSVWKYSTKSETNWSENASKIPPPYSDISPKPETSAECPLTDYRAVATNQQQNLPWWAFILTWATEDRVCIWTLLKQLLLDGHFCKQLKL